MSAIKELEVKIEQNNALILQLKEQNQKLATMIEIIKISEGLIPKVEDFVSKEAYLEAVKRWEDDFGN